MFILGRHALLDVVPVHFNAISSLMKNLFVTSALLGALVCPAFCQVPAPSESGVILKASELLPGEILQGESFRVRDQVPTDGYMAHFTIDSDFGTFTAVGVPQAKRRIAEIVAIRKLVETSKSDLFEEGLRRSVTQPIEAVKNIIDDPVESVKKAPKTVGHFFSKVGSGISRGVSKTADRIEAARNDDDSDRIGNAVAAGKGIGNAAKNVAGFDKARLDTAKQLGIDPYSDNVRLQEEMEKVTWAFFAGGLPLRIGAMAASAGLAVTATNMVGVPEDIYALTQNEITLRDEQTLLKIGVTAEDLEAFQNQPVLSTTRRHRIVSLLDLMPDTSGRGYVIRLANACQTADQAEILISALAILTENQKSDQYSAIKIIGRLPGGVSASGQLHVPAPVDHVTWTEEVAAFAQRNDLETGDKVLLHTGRMSEAATAGMQAAGWKMKGVAYSSR